MDGSKTFFRRISGIQETLEFVCICHRANASGVEEQLICKIIKQFTIKRSIGWTCVLLAHQFHSNFFIQNLFRMLLKCGRDGSKDTFKSSMRESMSVG